MAVVPFGTEYGALKRLENWDGLQQLDKQLEALRRQPNFFLVVPRILRVEGVHSDMLAWLLDPKGWHGLGAGFANGFLSTVLTECGMDRLRSVSVDEVHREFSTGNGPIDILMRVRYGDRGLIVGVENKIDSPEGENQLAKYLQGLAELFPTDLLVLVFLTPDNAGPESSPSCPLVSMAYSGIADHLDSAVRAASESAEMSGLTLVRHYASALRTHIMPESNPEIDAICRQLYDDHQLAWRAIRRRLPSKRDESHAYVGIKVAEHLGKQFGGKWQFVVRRDKYVCVFRPAWLQLGSSEADEIVGLSQTPESPRRYPKVHFRLVADRAESDAGERFHYRVRLKVDTAKNPTLGRELVRALDAVESIQSKLPARAQFTLPLKSTSQLPPIGDEPENVPDSVVDWFARHTAGLVPVIDSVFEQTQNGDPSAD